MNFGRAAVLAIVALLVSCPAPFGYFPDGFAEDIADELGDGSATSAVARPRVVTSSMYFGGEDDITNADVAFETNQSISLTTETEDARIFYTLNGDSPSPNAENVFEYSPESPIEITEDGSVVEIRAVALKRLMYPSEIVSATVSVDYDTVSTPAFSPAGGSSLVDPVLAQNPIEISISTQTPDAEIHFTISTDGTLPPVPVPGSPGVTQYTGPIALADDATTYAIKAVAVRDQARSSTVRTAVYRVDWAEASAPIVSPAPGLFHDDITVTLETEALVDALYYTIADGLHSEPDDPDPSNAAHLYTGPIPLTRNSRLKVIAVAAGGANVSEVAEHAYEFTPYPPVFDLPPGAIALPAPVSIESQTPGTTIAVALGSGPPAPYSGPFDVTSSSIENGRISLTASATRDGWTPSSTAATYAVYWNAPQPWSLAIDPAGKIVSVAPSQNSITRYELDGEFMSDIQIEGPPHSPRGLGFGPIQSTAYAAFTESNVVYALAYPDYSNAAPVGTGNYTLNGPRDVVVDSDGSMYIAEAAGGRILRKDFSGITSVFADESVFDPAIGDAWAYENPGPFALAVHRYDVGTVQQDHEYVFAVATRLHRLFVFRKDGNVRAEVQIPAAGGHTTSLPRGVAVHEDGHVYVMAAHNQQIHVYKPEWAITGNGDYTLYDFTEVFRYDASHTAGQVWGSLPRGVAVRDDLLYVGATGQNRIYMIPRQVDQYGSVPLE